MITPYSYLALTCSLFSNAPQEALPRRGALGLSVALMTPADMEKAGVKAGSVAVNVMSGMTADKAGIKPGDIILSINSKPVLPQTLGAMMREIPAGSKLTISAVRDKKAIELSTSLLERPRDPGNENYSVEYTHITSHGQRMRTLVTHPKRTGKHPVLFFIQGFSPVSYDFTLETSDGSVQSIDGPILREFANSNFIVYRIEKPGVGDSEGGPFADLDYMTELDIYRQALKQIKGLADADPENVFIFGHSMGGAFGPMIAAENPVKGICVYGTASRTWHEYIVDTIRYQGLVGGGSFEDADEEARLGSRLMNLVMNERKSPADVIKANPELAPLSNALFPGGLFNGKSLEFWRDLCKINFASYWKKCNTRVFAVKGASDFVTYEVDHKLIADIVNREHPGWGTWEVFPESDHLFHKFTTEQDSIRNFQRGKFNNAFAKRMMDWIKGVMAAK
jgi:pimeloyl-ACP methyl ester carboxylesterase